MSEKPTILIADDEPGVVAALAREARRAGLSYITDTTSQQVLELGADDYDVKPFDPSFMSKVARLAGASGERHH